MRPRRAKRTALWASFVLLTGLLAGAPTASAKDVDVSASPAGKKMAAESAARFTANGIRTEASDLRVYSRGHGEYLVAPRGTKLTGGGVVTADTPDSEMGAQAVLAAPYWSLRSSQCFARFRDVTGWMDACYHHYKVINDGSSTYDYHSLHFFATAKSEPSWRLREAWVESNRLGGAAQTWFDWDPRSDKDVNCQSQSLGVFAAGVGISFGHDHCEMWDITKYATAGRFRNTWRGYVIDHEREIAFVIAVRVAQGGGPVWSLNWDFDTILAI